MLLKNSPVVRLLPTSASTSCSFSSGSARNDETVDQYLRRESVSDLAVHAGGWVGGWRAGGAAV